MKFAKFSGRCYIRSFTHSSATRNIKINKNIEKNLRERKKVRSATEKNSATENWTGKLRTVEKKHSKR